MNTEARQSSRTSEIKVAILHDAPIVSAGLTSTLGARERFVLLSCEKPTLRDRARAFWDDVDVAVTDFETGVDLMQVSGGRGNVLVVTHDDSEAHVRMALEVGVRGYVLIGCDAATFTGSVLTVSSGGTALAPAISARIADSLSHQPLTPRELTVLRFVCVGLSNKAIANRLRLSCGTIKSHVKAILSKLNANSRTEASSIAQRRGIVDANSVGALDDPEVVGAQSRFIARSIGVDQFRHTRNLSVVPRIASA